MWNRTSTVRIGLAFTWELMEPFQIKPFQIEPIDVPERGHLKSRSSIYRTNKLSCTHRGPFSSGTLRIEVRENSTDDN